MTIGLCPMGNLRNLNDITNICHAAASYVSKITTASAPSHTYSSFLVLSTFRHEDPRLNIQNLRPWDKVILLEQLVSDRDEREAQRRFTVPGTTSLRRAAETPLDDDRPSRRMRPWESTESPPRDPLSQRRTGLRRDPGRPSKVLKK